MTNIIVKKNNIMFTQIINSEFFKSLSKLGQVYFVGGCVRDFYLNKECKDYDLIVRKIELNQLISTLSKFGKVDVVGESFGVIKFNPFNLTLEEPIDIALPRTEKKVGTGHKGFEIVSDPNLSLKEDLKRRDFTINALAFDKDLNLVDHFNGHSDLLNKEIKMVDEKAFSDDPLRILRGIQFASRFQFSIEDETLSAMQENVESLRTISQERFFIEFDKIVRKGDIFTALNVMNEVGLHEIFGEIELADFQTDNVGDLLLLFEDISFFDQKLIDKSILNRYKALIYIEKLNISNVDDFTTQDVANVNKIDPTVWQSALVNEIMLFDFNYMKKHNIPLYTKGLAITGGELMKLGFSGKAIGDKQKELLQLVWEEKCQNTVESLIKNIL